MSESKFFDIVKTDIVCRREETENGRIRAERVKAWLDEVLSQPEVLGVIGWIQLDCEDPTWEEPMFIVYIKKGTLPKDMKDDPFVARRYYAGIRESKIENTCPGLVWCVEEVDEMPEFTKEDIMQICWCGMGDTFTVWRR